MLRSTRSLRNRWRHGLAMVWSLALALTMFTLSYPDCRAVQMHDVLAGAAQTAAASVAAEPPASLGVALVCEAPAGAPAAGEHAHDLPDFDLAPVPHLGLTNGPPPDWSVRVGAMPRSAVVLQPLRPPNA